MPKNATIFLSIIFIFCWWAFAFQHNTNQKISPLVTSPSPPSYNLSSITLIQREQLQAALSGNIEIMTSLIADWDIEAQMMQEIHAQRYRRLPQETFLRSQILGRHLQLSHNYKNQNSSSLSQKRYLPQTYAAASLLLALTEPEEIVALPEMMRNQTQLFPPSLTNLIPLDVGRYNSEKIHLMSPSIAFIANYSQPSTVQVLKDQGVLLYTMGNLNSIIDISAEILKIGAIIERPQKAELLAIFIEAAMCAIDNQLKVLTQKIIDQQGEIPRVLFLTHFQHFSVPSPKSLTGQLLERIATFDITLKYASETAPADKWVVPIGKEQIVSLNPDCIIIVTENKQAIEDEIRKENAFHDVLAVKNNKIFFLDNDIQLSPTQYSVLAYQDLIEALARLL